MRTDGNHLMEALSALRASLRRALGRLRDSTLFAPALRPVQKLVGRVRAHFARVPGRFYPLLAVGALGGATVLLPLGALPYYLTCGFEGCPEVGQLELWQPGGASVLLDREGERFADLAPYERTIVPLDSLPEHLSAAFLAVEDRRFFRHRGVDWIRVAGAAAANLRNGSISQGSSTISMQLARNVFPRELPGAERTFKRKFREVRVARLIEGSFEKDEILEMYLNHIYFGGGAYGVEAAARLYFDKSASALSIAEAATLAALPKAPSHYDPRRQPERSRERRDLVLGLMERDGALSEEEADAARASEISVAEGRVLDAPFGGYFIDVVQEILEAAFEGELYAGRLRIHTTLDRRAQAAAEAELEAQLHALDPRGGSGEEALQGAVVLMEAGSGAVRALVGGRASATTRYNRAIHGRRQLGSAFKPFVFAAALGEGIPTSRLLMDLPLRMALAGQDDWNPGNYDGRYEGEVSFREALVRSRNVPTVRLAASVGIPDVARFARTAGLDAVMDETPSLALGTVAASPLQVATAYTTFATLGSSAHPYFVVRVEDAEGRILWEPELPAPTPTMDPRVAYIITDILRDALDRGTGAGARAAGFTGAAAGKTGTTNDATDAWFIGFTPEIVGAVWIGYDRPTSLGSTATGGGLAAPVWGRIMRRAELGEGRGAEWTVPDGVVELRVDDRSGFLLAESCRSREGESHLELFLVEHLPETVCPSQGFLPRLWNGIRGTASRMITPRRIETSP